MTVCIDPAGAVIEASAVLFWLVLSWFTFQLVVEWLSGLVERANQITVSDLLKSVATRVWQRLRTTIAD